MREVRGRYRSKPKINAQAENCQYLQDLSERFKKELKLEKAELEYDRRASALSHFLRIKEKLQTVLDQDLQRICVEGREREAILATWAPSEDDEVMSTDQIPLAEEDLDEIEDENESTLETGGIAELESQAVGIADDQGEGGGYGVNPTDARSKWGTTDDEALLAAARDLTANVHDAYLLNAIEILTHTIEEFETNLLRPIRTALKEDLLSAGFITDPEGPVRARIRRSGKGTLRTRYLRRLYYHIRARHPKPNGKRKSVATTREAGVAVMDAHRIPLRERSSSDSDDSGRKHDPVGYRFTALVGSRTTTNC